MKRITVFPLLASAFLLFACSDGSSLPEATGKASVKAINAIYGSPAITFLIEERAIGTVSYKNTSVSASYDDLEYTFNFETFFAGDSEFTRIASRRIDFVADMHYTLLASGDINAPTVTVWETAQREFADTDTVFQAQFAHASGQLGSIDIYFALDGVAPVQGEQVATLSRSEISAPMDFETDAYVVTVTTAGDASAILHQSVPSNLLARTNLIIAPFDGDENDTSPITVRGLSVLGGGITFHDPLFPSTLQLLHAAKDLGNTNVYDDEMLMSLVLSNHDHKDLTPAAPIAPGDYEYFYAPVTDPTMTALSTAFTTANGFNYRIIAVGSGTEFSTTNVALDNRSILTTARLNFFNSTTNFDFTDLYIVDAGTMIDGSFPFRIGLISRSTGGSFDVVPGDYDMYLTDFQGTEAIAGPLPLNVDFGDVVDVVVFDTDDPAVLEMVDISGAP